MDQIFEDGLKVGREREFLGHRSIISTNPLKFADRYEWITYGEVDEKRRYIGSAMHSLFSKDEVGGGEYQTVGIWSANRPGICYLNFARRRLSNKTRVANYRYCYTILRKGFRQLIRDIGQGRRW